MMNAVDIATGATGTGVIGLLFWFVKKYFSNREDAHRDTKIKADSATIGVAKLEGVVEIQTKLIMEVRDDVKFMRAQMAKVFKYIDAPKRETDISKELS